MNKAKLKAYAPQARKDFIAAVIARANQLGLSEKAGKLEAARRSAAMSSSSRVSPIPKRIAAQRDKLAKRIAQQWLRAGPWRPSPTPGSTASSPSGSWNCTATWTTATGC